MPAESTMHVSAVRRTLSLSLSSSGSFWSSMNLITSPHRGSASCAALSVSTEIAANEWIVGSASSSSPGTLPTASLESASAMTLSFPGLWTIVMSSRNSLRIRPQRASFPFFKKGLSFSFNAQMLANASFSAVFHFRCSALKALLANRIGLIRPSSSSCCRTAPIPTSEASTSTWNSLLKSGWRSMVASATAALTASKARWCSGRQSSLILLRFVLLCPFWSW
mmetsp:Transcript_11331/g.18631  ORF Transcript_11331/g.18631 Transcript_11331/m.18631 type:complete len:223 (+) Transcript_11331:5828-6496(+)